MIFNLNLVCQDGDLRIVRNGSLEVCINNTYGAVCDDFWDNQDALVACHQLGFGNGELEIVEFCIIITTYSLKNCRFTGYPRSSNFNRYFLRQCSMLRK